jgi:hypothetical protein
MQSIHMTWHRKDSHNLTVNLKKLLRSPSEQDMTLVYRKAIIP